MTIRAKFRDEFFAVTTAGSVYKVSGIRDLEGKPFIIKIAENGNPCKDTVRSGRRFNEHYIGILYGMLLRFGLQNEKPCLPEGVDPKFWPWRSSPITALFLTAESAVDCSMYSDLELYDQRWKIATDAIVNSIGRTHPVFILPSKPFELQTGT